MLPPCTCENVRLPVLDHFSLDTFYVYSVSLVTTGFRDLSPPRRPYVATLYIEPDFLHFSVRPEKETETTLPSLLLSPTMIQTTTTTSTVSPQNKSIMFRLAELNERLPSSIRKKKTNSHLIRLKLISRTSYVSKP